MCLCLSNGPLGSLGANPRHLQARTCQIEIMSHMCDRLGRIESDIGPADTTVRQLVTTNRYDLVVWAMLDVHDSVDTRNWH